MVKYTHQVGDKNMTSNPESLPTSEGLQNNLTKLQRLNTKGNWKEAADCFQRVNKEVVPLVIDIMLEGALAHRMLSGENYDTAEVILNQAISMAEGINDPERHLLAIVGLGDLARSGAKKNEQYKPKLGREGKLQLAREYEEQAKSIIENISSSSLAIVKAYCEFGLLDVEEEKYDEALKDYSQAREEAELLVKQELRDNTAKSQLARTYTLTGEAYEKKKSYNDAYDWHKKAYNDYSEIEDKRGMALGAQGMAHTYEGLENIEKAVEQWERVKKIAISGDETDNYMLSKAKKALERLQLPS